MEQKSQYNLLGEVLHLAPGERLAEESPSTLAETPSQPKEDAKEELLDDGWLSIWIFRFFVFYGCLFSCFAVIAVRLAAIPQHILLFTRADDPGFAGALTFMTFQWMLCIQALVAQVLWNFMVSMVSKEKPLVRFRTTCATMLGISTNLMDFLLALAFIFAFAVHHRYLLRIEPHFSPLASLTCITYVTSVMAVCIRQFLALRRKYACNSRSQFLDQVRHSELDEYRGIRLAAKVIVAQLVLSVVAFCAMRIAGASLVKDSVCFLSLVIIPALMAAFTLIFNHSIMNQTKLGECNVCCCSGSHACGSFFSIVCTICGLLLIFVYIMESQLVRAVWPVDMSTDDDQPMSGGGAWDMYYESPSEELLLGSYPVCKMNFGSKEHHISHRLTPLDLALLADASYRGNVEALNMTVWSGFAGTELSEWSLVVPAQDPLEPARVVHFRLPEAGVDVIAVRGSAIAQDWAYNAYLWAPGLFWNIFMNYAMPFGMLMGNEVGQYFLSQEILMGSNINENMYVEKLRYIQGRVEQSRREGFTPLLTGHSLGGGVAQAAGALFGVSTMTFSPVGLTYSETRVRWAMGMRTKQDDPVMNNIVSVVPVGDPVPMLEPQSGMVQQIHCGANPVFDGNPIACHALERTMCELYRKCGDPRHRAMNYCQKNGYLEELPWQSR
mmetsp:Transcript_98697/g.254996  ORF Transcript_98697/g.254996 Transcript_98697/m.254996 type:complete len:667 (+) Transcript_98697:54-2054(+)